MEEEDVKFAIGFLPVNRCGAVIVFVSLTIGLTIGFGIAHFSSKAESCLPFILNSIPPKIVIPLGFYRLARAFYLP